MSNFKLFSYFLFLSLFGFACSSNSSDEEEGIIPEEEEIVVENVGVGLVTHYKLDGNADDATDGQFHAKVIGEPTTVTGADGAALLFNENDLDNGCGQPGGSYIELPTYGAIWEEGFSVSAWVRFSEIRNYERIIDLGNGTGESGGMPITFSRLEETNDLALTSWNDDGYDNRFRGRVVATDAIKNGEMQLFTGTIDKQGHMAIYVDGIKVSERTDGQAVVNVKRSSNYIGHSNYCNDDPDFKGIIDDVQIYNYALTEEEVAELFGGPKP